MNDTVVSHFAGGCVSVITGYPGANQAARGLARHRDPCLVEAVHALELPLHWASSVLYRALWADGVFSVVDCLPIGK